MSESRSPRFDGCGLSRQVEKAKSPDLIGAFLWAIGKPFHAYATALNLLQHLQPLPIEACYEHY